jgi:hypothetical protein
MEEINPYAAPQTELVSSESRPAMQLRQLDWCAWATVFALNLIVPVLGGLQVLRNPGQWTSMVAGIACIFLFSCWKIAKAPQYFSDWMKNGIFLILFQLLPALHLILGMGAVLIGFVVEIFLFSTSDRRFGLQTWVGGFIATSLMGLFLMGFIIAFIRDDYRRKRKLPTLKEEH